MPAFFLDRSAFYAIIMVWRNSNTSWKMSVNPRHNKFADGCVRIDYVSLFKFWKGLTPYQADILTFGFSGHEQTGSVKPESLQRVKEKLTPKQQELLMTNFFTKLLKQNFSKATNRKVMLDLQDQLEGGLISSSNDFDYDGAPPKEARIKKGVKSYEVRYNGVNNVYDIYDVPEKISRWRVWRIVQQYQSAKCFYTDEVCLIAIKRSDWSVSEEHLIPQIVGGQRRNKNNVVAANWVNNILGGAPIHAKMDVKRALNKIVCHPSLTMLERKTVYEKVINYVLDQYRVYGLFPWNEPPKKIAEKAKTINKANKVHRKAEKKFIDEVLGDSRNIAMTLKEITDGMEQAYYESV